VRGIVGDSLTPELAVRLASAFGTPLAGSTVVIGRDTRPSGDMLKSAVQAGLQGAGCRVVDLGVATTPGVAVMVRERSAAGGIVITASHNPSGWNGLKFLTAEGSALTARQASAVFARFRDGPFAFASHDECGEVERDLSAANRHIVRVMQIVDAAAVRRRQLNVVLDSINGAGGASGRMLLEHLGCQVTHINADAGGRFAHGPEPTAENLAGLGAAVRDNGADVGFAQDPDADRLAIVDDKGRYIGEECTLALAARSVLSKTPGPVAANLSTSRMIDDIARQFGAPAVVHRTAVGEANVVEAIRRHHCVLGGEGNGGVIDPRVVLVRDSLTSMALVLGLMAEDWRPVHHVVDDLPQYVMVKEKFDADRAGLGAWLERVRMSAEGGSINDMDGLRIDWPEGWVHVRGSNTEPVARVIAEAADDRTARALIERVTQLR
jgi:phosphomannomutase